MHATAPNGTDLVAVSEKLIANLKEQSLDAEAARQLPAAATELLEQSGLLRLRVPRSRGGLEADNTTTTQVITNLTRGDGSVGWTMSVWAISSWMTGLFPDDVQETLFEDPNVRISGILSPGGIAIPVDGGYVVSGRWPFNSGVAQAQWNTNAAVIQAEGKDPEPVMIALPVADLILEDDWDSSGLRGSGSVTAIAHEVFVPAARVLPMGPAIQGLPPANSNAATPMYRTPFMVMASLSVGAVAVGLAQAALEAFMERLPGRKITYTDYTDQSSAPVTHLQVGEATRLVEEARMHIETAARQSDLRSERDEQWSIEDRVEVRLRLGAAVRRSREAVNLLAGASGGSSTYSTVAIQRIQRDMNTLSLHAVMNPDTNDELYGRVVCGLPPNTLYF